MIAVLAVALHFVAFTAPAAAASSDRVHYVLGGTMSGPFDLRIDLTDGGFAEAPKSWSLPGVALSPARSGTITPDDLVALRRLGAAVVAESTAPRRRLLPGEAPSLPCAGPPDALFDLTVVVDARTGGAGGATECKSAAVAAFLDRMFAAIRPRP